MVTTYFFVRALATHPAWCANPWVDWETRLPPPSEDIVLLGTGLTTVDAIIRETSVARITERGATRLDDQTAEASMELRKKEGYF